MSIEALRQITVNRAWRELIESKGEWNDFRSWAVEDFETYWIEAGHRIREQMSDDVMLCQFLRSVLTPHMGGEMVLFRGENQKRLEAGCIGMNWSSERDVARMFASGLNSSPGGGFLLKARFAASRIIASPSSHSVYLGEHQFTVVPPDKCEVEVLETFPDPAANAGAVGA